MVGRDAERFARSEIPVPIPSNAERLEGPGTFDMLQSAAKHLDHLLENMADVADMTGELIEAAGKADAETARERRQYYEARAYRALQPFLNAAIRQGGQVGTELADYLKASPSLAYWLARWQGKA
jgi:ATP phosphoribosyltransferase regulatory subunit HisZ